MKRESRRTSKYLLLALILIAVFVLPGCRTRLTNNSEVSNVQYDEDGYMSDMYQMRRDELGLTTAERPILPDLGSGQSDENDDFSEGEEINYNPEDYQEDFTEPQTNTNTNTNTNTGTRRNTTNNSGVRQRTPSGRRSSSGSGTYTIEFNANGGLFADGSNVFKANVPKEDKIGKHFPDPPTREGYEFEYWYAKAGGENGTRVQPDKVMTKGTTLFAQWKEKEKEGRKEEYTISFNYNGGDELELQRIRKEGETYGTLPNPKWRGHHFGGWYDDKGNRIEANKKVTSNIVLRAKWTDWKKTYSEAKKNTKEKTCFIAGDITDDKFIKDCNLKYVEDANSADCIIAFVSNTDDAEQIAKDYPGIKVIALNEEAITSSDEYDSLLYKIVILNEIHGQKLKLAQAQDEIEKEADFKTAKTDKSDPEPEPEPEPTPDPDSESQTEP